MALSIGVSAKAVFQDGSLRVLRLVGRESLSALFELEVDVVTTSTTDVIETNLRALLDEPVRLDFVDDAAARTHHVYGLIRSIESMAAPREGDPLHHRLVIVPRLWRATQQVGSRLVHETTVPKTVLNCLKSLDRPLDQAEDVDDGGTVGMSSGSRVQYEESTFAFISRLLEDEGIGYRFRHDHDEEREQLVLFNDNDALVPRSPATGSAFNAARTLPSVPYVRADRPDARQAAIYELRRRVVTVPAAVTLLDHDYERPLSQPLGEAKAGASALRSVGSIYTSREPTLTATTTAADGKTSVATNAHAVSKVRLEERLARQCVYHGRSSRHEMHAGDRFNVDNAPFGSGGLDLVVTEVRHSVTFDASVGEPEGYSNTFVAIDAATPYRPERLTPKARITGLTYGRVVDKSGGLDDPPTIAAPIDKQGRYRVALFFMFPVVTAWIRRIQPLAGPGSGMHFPLQVGTEVVVAFIDGDPDRPMIVGAVPNAISPSPVTEVNSTQHVIQTSSGARIEIEDNA